LEEEMRHFKLPYNFDQVLILSLTVWLISGCYFVDFFKSKKQGDGSNAAYDPTGVLGRSLGERAGGVDEAALAVVYGITTEIPPAAVRPDPDLYARRLLRQYRDEGSTVARQIGRIEDYRELLGGASEDFQKTPQEEYDATSLLATLQVTEVVCEGLVSPNQNMYPGWSSILPAPADDWQTNIRFLAQRFLGKPSDQIDGATIERLKGILDLSRVGGVYTPASYIHVCATLSLDAEAAFL
jgi:hypothetical protein